MLDEIKKKLRYMAVGDSNNLELNPVIDAQSGKMTGSEFINHNPSFLNRVRETIGVPSPSPKPQPSLPPSNPIVRDEKYFITPKKSVLGMVNEKVGGKPTPTPTPTQKPKGVSKKDWNEMKLFFAKQAKQRGYSRGALVGQKALESARGTSQFAQERNNFGGIGAYDSDHNQAFSFESPEAYMDYYDKMIQKRFPRAYENRANPQRFLEELKAGNYATDPDYVSNIMNTPEFREYNY